MLKDKILRNLLIICAASLLIWYIFGYFIWFFINGTYGISNNSSNWYYVAFDLIIFPLIALFSIVTLLGYLIYAKNLIVKLISAIILILVLWIFVNKFINDWGGYISQSSTNKAQIITLQKQS